MSEEGSDGTSPEEAVTFEIHLYWASWAAPSLPAPLTARELESVLPSDVAVRVHDVSVSDGTVASPEDPSPRVLPTWRIRAVRNSCTVDERVLEGAHPKFAVREALDEVRNGERRDGELPVAGTVAPFAR